MDISIYLESIEVPEFNLEGILHKCRLGDVISINTKEQGFPNLSDIDIAIIGVNESRLSVNNFGTSKAPNTVRQYLYPLYQMNPKTKIADLGNIKAGHSIEDTYFAVKTVVGQLLQQNIVPIIIGGSQDLTYANYMAYEKTGRIINIASIDSGFNLGDNEHNFNSKTYLSKIILHKPSFLFNFTNIGYQTYFVDQETIKLMKNLFFDVYRLGEMRNNIEEIEPLVRNADLLTFNIGAIRQSEAPGNANVSPNGFDGEEACRIARYAGLSDKLTSFGLYEINPEKDSNGQTSHLAAQIIWYFIDGFYQRKEDFPNKQREDYLKFIVGVEDGKYEIIFYKSKINNRWWMQVPANENIDKKYERHFIVPCSAKDYETANKNEIPDRWWQVYQKLV